MGNCNLVKEPLNDEIIPPNKMDYNILYVIGRGGFGKVILRKYWKVYKVQEKKTKELFALKEMSKFKYKLNVKKRVIAKKSVSSVMNERYLLSNLNHP